MPSKCLFLDWAGDLGFEFGRGSTSHLVMVFAMTTNYATFRQTMADLRARRGLHKVYEHHYAHIPKAEREAYFTALRAASFQAWALVVDKRQLSEGPKRMNQYDLFGKLVADLARRLPVEALQEAILLVDAHTTTTQLTRTIRVAISNALRGRGTQRRVKKVRGRPAHLEDGLQLADMVAGAVVGSKVEGTVDHLAGLEEKITVWRYAESNV